MIRNSLLTVLAVSLASLAASNAAQAQGASDLDAYLASVVERTDIPGVVAIVVDGDGILYSAAFGLRDVGKGLPMTSDTIFRIASMTKPVTSTAVMMLVEEGAIDLDDPIGDYLPAFAGLPVFDSFDAATGTYTTRPAAGPITIRHLLTHTSGIGYTFSNEILARLAQTGSDVVPEATPLLFDPGTRWAYGASTRVLGQLVEAVSGQSLDDFMRARIFVPLGMHDTSYATPVTDTGRVATTHARGEQGLVETPNPAAVTSPDNGDGGLNSTAADYARFIQLFLNGGRGPDGARLLKRGTVRRMGRPQTGNVYVELQPAAIPNLTRPFPLGAGRDRYGLGFQVTGEHEADGMRSAGSLSWAGIFNTEFWIDTERGIGAVLLMQYLPFYDEAAIETLQGFEKRVYATF